MGAATLKLAGLNVTPFAQYGWLSSATVQLAAVQWEIILGLWLLSGRGKAWAWLLALTTFLMFAGVSLWLGLIGQASCGCFGAVKASPWHAFAVDVLALALLGVGRPDWSEATITRSGLQGVGIVAAGGLLLIGIGWGAAVGLYGSVGKALAVLRNERLALSPATVDFGTGKAGREVETSVEVVNHTDAPVHIFGGTSDCCLRDDVRPPGHDPRRRDAPPRGVHALARHDGIHEPQGVPAHGQRRGADAPVRAVRLRHGRRRRRAVRVSSNRPSHHDERRRAR